LGNALGGPSFLGPPRSHHLPDDVLPGGGGSAGGSGRGARPGQDRGRWNPRGAEAAHPGAHVRLEFANPQALETAAAIVPSSARDEDGLALRVPSDAHVRSLRELLDRLVAASIEVASFSLHTPDLDDVFLILTGDPGMERSVAP
jgi:hypothetical protein